MQTINPDYPLLDTEASPKDCIAWLRKLTYWIGAGFHPENSADQYVVGDESGCLRPSFPPAICRRMDADMERCYAVLQPLGKDPCSIALKVQRRMIAGRAAR